MARKPATAARTAKQQSEKIVEAVVKTRTLYAELNGGNMRKIEIPSDWVVTFGPIAVGVGRNGQESPNVLRIYSDTKRTDLVAVYRDVKAVSDERVKVTEKTVKKKQKVFQKNGPNGNQQWAAEIRKTEWKNPFADEPEADDEDDFGETFLAIPEKMNDEAV